MFSREAAPYPSPGQFAAGVGAAVLREAIARSNDEPIPKSVTLAIHVPRSSGAARDADLARLHREIGDIARRIDRDRGVAELVVDAAITSGPLRELPWAELLSTVERHFYLAADTARTLLADAACGPVDFADLGVLRSAGFNRLALAAGKKDEGLVRTARRCGFETIAVAVDCLRSDEPAYGLRQALDIAVTAHPERLEIRSPAPDPEGGDVLGDALRVCIETAGYSFIGPDLYALGTDDLVLASRAGSLRYGVFGYTATGHCDLVGLGPGAVSQVGDCLARNAPRLVDWRQAVDSGHLPALHGVILSDEDRLRDAVIQSLLCQRAIPVRDLEAEFDIDFRQHFAPELARLAGLPITAQLRDAGSRIEVGSPGWPWLRTMARCFDAYVTWRDLPQET